MLNDSEKLLTTQLRRQGMGYRAIAAQIGKSRDEVRDYLKRSGTGTSQDEQSVVHDNAVCPCCGKKLVPQQYGRPARFCSDECRRRWWKKNPGMGNPRPGAIYTFDCKCCGRRFSAYGNSKRKFCSCQCSADYKKKR